MGITEECTGRLGYVEGRIQRTQRHPQCTEGELFRFFAQVSYGYCFKQAAHRAGIGWHIVQNSLHSDDDIMNYALDLSIVAGAQIKSGQRPIPDRWDGLYAM